MKLLLLSLLWCASVAAQQKFTVYFDSAKDEATEVSATDFKQWIANNKEADIINIKAYADSVGKETDNYDLSARRLLYVSNTINTNGIFFKNINLQAFGETKSTTGTLAGNRRVDIFYNQKKVEGALTKQLQNAVIGQKLRLENFNFYGNSTIPLPESMPVLEELLQIMKDNPALKIDIQGHICCERRDTEKLAERRAKSIYTYLVKNGIEEERLTYRSYGSSRPIYLLPEDNEEQRVANRRVEIEIMEK
jgi:outer membrane protein OmpA-like peptidoglycan-associated protein